MYKLEHACIRVFDLEKSQKFYEDALGLEVVKRKDFEEQKFTLVYMSDKNRNFEIELTYNYNPKEPYNLGNGFSHFAVITPDIKASRERHLELGIECTPTKSLGAGFASFYFISDPDGYKIEVIER
ncbi:MAG: lactoylglutathione lyase [Candidatus Epulonipiscium fishelsonii]|nr:MAG: lactoylglutathione lyase [Epulopiscium sp. AS2M-Bin002]